MRRSIDSAGTANRAAREDRFFGITVGRFRQTHRECSIIRCGSSIAPDRDTAVYATRELGIAMANHGDRKSEESKRPAAGDRLMANLHGTFQAGRAVRPHSPAIISPSASQSTENVERSSSGK